MKLSIDREVNFSQLHFLFAGTFIWIAEKAAKIAKIRTRKSGQK